jgi:hypothetical protein
MSDCLPPSDSASLILVPYDNVCGGAVASQFLKRGLRSRHGCIDARDEMRLMAEIETVFDPRAGESCRGMKPFMRGAHTLGRREVKVGK